MTGHIALSPMTFDVYPTSTRGYGLGPVAVLPDYQRMVIELKKGTLANYHGYARYHPTFHEVE